MNEYYVFDFDNTIYGGDSSREFFLFVLRRHPKALLTVPAFLLYACLYALKRCTKEQMKEHFFAVVRYVPDIDAEVRAFWEKHAKKMHTWYHQRSHKADIIISASPEFLLKPVMEPYQVAATIGTVVDPLTGRFLSFNCYGEEKVFRIQKLFGSITCAEFYSDSASDFPLAELAERAYKVRNGAISPWNDRIVAG